jgi:threonine/homoserine/homoserine lactone efflux protein
VGEAIGSTLGLAIGIALSPLPVAAVILMLFSARARSNSLAFMVGWVVGIALVASLVTLIPGLGTDDGEPSTRAGWVKLALGALLLVAGVARWRARPKGEQEARAPKWMQKIDELRPGAALGMGFVLSAVNPKNLLLAAAAGATIAEAALGGGETAAVIAVFTLVAASTVLVPVFGYLIAGKRLDPTLLRAKDWLVANNAAVMAVLFLVFGVNLVGDGLGILTS